MNIILFDNLVLVKIFDLWFIFYLAVGGVTPTLPKRADFLRKKRAPELDTGKYFVYVMIMVYKCENF